MTTREELVRLIARYETEQPVETYRCYDWYVWPLIRIQTHYEALKCSVKPTSFSALQPTAKSVYGFKEYLMRVPQLLPEMLRLITTRGLKQKTGAEVLINEDTSQDQEWTRLLAADPEHNDSPVAPGRDVVILTLSGRRQQTENGLYEIYSDPLVEFFQERGVSTLVWETDEERWPRCSRSAWISRLLTKELSETTDVPFPDEPDWYRDVAPFTAEMLSGRTLSWAEIGWMIRTLQQQSLVFERWLLKTEAKILISVCWYNLTVMAATLASRRLGIVSADLQHGTQGSEHFAYSGWSKRPVTGYEIIPDTFLNWGKTHERNLLEHNPAFDQNIKTIVGGNLWFNKGRTSIIALNDSDWNTLFKKISDFKRIILVSLTDFGEGNDFFVKAIDDAPDEWFWLFRFHPATPQHEKEKIITRLQQSNSNRFDYELASSVPLYPLLSASSAHATTHSTVTLEALGFGLPTVTITRTGAAFYKDLIDVGVVIFAETTEEFLSAIRRCKEIPPELCRDVASDYFALPEVAEAGLKSLLSRAGVSYGGEIGPS